MNNQSFGQKLRALRKKTGKSQTEVVWEIKQMFPNSIQISQASLSVLEQRATEPRERYSRGLVQILLTYL